MRFALPCILSMPFRYKNHAEQKGTPMADELDHLDSVDNPGYHLKNIPRGEVGELSKVYEEILEALDADAQGTSIMALVELSDLIGALKAYLAKHHPSLTLNDLEAFADITRRAFTSGRRS